MAKILGICGSPRKSSTYRSLEIAIDFALKHENVEAEIIALRGKTVKPCNHCDRCKKEKILCPIKDEMAAIYPKIIEADAFIFASPVYCMNITPQMHAFFTRWRPLHHAMNGIVKNKLAAAIAVGGTRNGGQEMAINAMIHVAMTRGLIFIGNEPGNYSGGMVWSKDQGADGVEADLVGVESLKKLGNRVAEIAIILEKGKK
ncbi:MAG: flavodoxin family protein [Bacillota bacterium]